VSSKLCFKNKNNEESKWVSCYKLARVLILTGDKT